MPEFLLIFLQLERLSFQLDCAAAYHSEIFSSHQPISPSPLSYQYVSSHDILKCTDWLFLIRITLWTSGAHFEILQNCYQISLMKHESSQRLSYFWIKVLYYVITKLIEMPYSKVMHFYLKDASNSFLSEPQNNRTIEKKEYPSIGMDVIRDLDILYVKMYIYLNASIPCSM